MVTNYISSCLVRDNRKGRWAEATKAKRKPGGLIYLLFWCGNHFMDESIC